MIVQQSARGFVPSTKLEKAGENAGAPDRQPSAEGRPGGGKIGRSQETGGNRQGKWIVCLMMTPLIEKGTKMPGNENAFRPPAMSAPGPGGDPEDPTDLPPGDFPAPQPGDPPDFPPYFPPGDLPGPRPIPNPIPGGT